MSHRRPRILIVKPIVPYPPNQGTKVATFGLINALRGEFDITVLARTLSPADVTAARELGGWCNRVVTVPAPNRRSAFHRVFYKFYYGLLSMVLRRSLKTLYDCPGPLVKAARELARENFDLVIVEYWQLQELLDLFPAERTVLLTHDVDMLVNRQISLLERNLGRKIQAVRRWLLEQKEELRAYRRARHVWTLTERDRAAVRSLSSGAADVEVLPYGLDIDFHRPSGMRRNRGEVLFMGYLGAAFNRDALEYFVRRVYPHLDGIAGLSITIVGGELPKELEFFGLQPEVEVVGSVPDVRPYLHRASCLVIPLRYGGGLRIRILEAMAARLPIVCTPVAIAGMPFEADKEYLVAREPAEFAAQIRRVLEDEVLARRLAEAAARAVEERYGAARQATRSRDMVWRLLSAI